MNVDRLRSRQRAAITVIPVDLIDQPFGRDPRSGLGSQRINKPRLGMAKSIFRAGFHNRSTAMRTVIVNGQTTSFPCKTLLIKTPARFHQVKRGGVAIAARPCISFDAAIPNSCKM